MPSEASEPETGDVIPILISVGPEVLEVVELVGGVVALEEELDDELEDVVVVEVPELEV